VGESLVGERLECEATSPIVFDSKDLKVVEAFVKISFPELAGRESPFSLGEMIDHYYNPVRAAKNAPTTIPLLRRLRRSPLTFSVDTVSYVPANDSVLIELLEDTLDELGVPQDVLWRTRQHPHAHRDPNARDPKAQIYYNVFLEQMKTRGTISLELDSQSPVKAFVKGTLSITGLMHPRYPEITPAILPRAVFKEQVHTVHFADGLAPKARGMHFPESLERISIYTTDHHGSGWSFHCTGLL
jgi:hypothetical protein